MHLGLSDLPYRNHTPQEKLVRRVLEENGLLYQYQIDIGQYTVDFYLPELQVIVEADGVFGHLKKRDKQRDYMLAAMGYQRVWHLKETTISGLRNEFNILMKGAEENYAGTRTDRDEQPS
jgi:very-short-patch-repair endonuclease